MRHWLAALALTALACGGGGQAAQQAQTPATPAGGEAAQAAAPATGTVHEVKMGTASNPDTYDPATLTIKVGDTVKWINEHGGPHNVAF